MITCYLAIKACLNIRNDRHDGCAPAGVEQVKFRLLTCRAIEHGHEKISAIIRELDADAFFGAIPFAEQLGV